MTNIKSESRRANIIRDHEIILPDDATPKPDGIFGKDRRISRSNSTIRWQNYRVSASRLAESSFRYTQGSGEGNARPTGAPRDAFGELLGGGAVISQAEIRLRDVMQHDARIV